MTRYGENFELDQDLMDVIATYMDDDIREDFHAMLAPCEPKLFLCAYLYRDPDFWELLRNEFDIRISDAEIISTLIKASDGRVPELNLELCKLAGLEDEYNHFLEEIDDPDDDYLKRIIGKAADILGVEIYDGQGNA